MCDYILPSSNYCQLRQQLFVVNVGCSFLKLYYWKWQFDKKKDTENIEAPGHAVTLRRILLMFYCEQTFGL